MKKSLLAMLLAVALVAPVFAADKGSKELDIKAGVTVMPKCDVDSKSGDVDASFLAELDFFYYVMPELAIGAGVNNIFNAKIKDVPGDPKIGFTNIYAQAKYVFDLNDDLFNNIYPLVQIGYGIVNLDTDFYDVDSNGIYWGIGAGTTIKENFVFEILYSQNKGTMKTKGYPSTFDATYSALQIKVGYKFNF